MILFYLDKYVNLKISAPARLVIHADQFMWVYAGLQRGHSFRMQCDDEWMFWLVARKVQTAITQGKGRELLISRTSLLWWGAHLAVLSSAVMDKNTTAQQGSKKFCSTRIRHLQENWGFPTNPPAIPDPEHHDRSSYKNSDPITGVPWFLLFG